MRKHLYKYFSKMEHAENFCDGHLLFRSLAYFRDYEDKKVRRDKYEGSYVYRPSDGLLITNQTQGTQFVLEGHSFVSTAKYEEIFVFCLSAVFDRILFERFNAVACVEVGDIGAFCARVGAALPPKASVPATLGRRRIGHWVKYYNETECGDPRWALPDRIATSKLRSYAWQREFRLLFSTTNAFECENVAPSLVSDAHREIANSAQHHRHDLNASSLRDICHIRAPLGPMRSVIGWSSRKSRRGRRGRDRSDRSSGRGGAALYSMARLDGATVIASHRASKDARPSGRAMATRSRGTQGAQRSLDCFVAMRESRDGRLSTLAMTTPIQCAML
jgi:hypothetical protein